MAPGIGMNVRQIETFDAVMKVESISRAAELLNVTQPVVSRTIADLESAIGFQLFERARNRIVPTPEARRFYGDVSSLYQGFEALRSSAARIRDAGTGQIRLGVLPALGYDLVPRALRQFHESHPDVTVNLTVIPSRGVREGIQSGQFDVGVAADEAEAAGTSQVPFASSRVVCVMPVGHRLGKLDIIRPEDLRDERFIGYSPEDRNGRRVLRSLEECGVHPNVVMETPSGGTICALVSEGLGIGLVTPYSLLGLSQAKLIARPFEPAIYCKTTLLLPIDRPKSLLVRTMIDCLMVCR